MFGQVSLSSSAHAPLVLLCVSPYPPTKCLTNVLCPKNLSTPLFHLIYLFIPQRFFTLSHSPMAAEHGKDSTLNSDLNPRAQQVRCCCCSLLHRGFLRYFMALNMRSSSTEPGIITITSSASLKTSPNSRRPPKRSASCQNSYAEGKKRGGLSARWLIICVIAAAGCVRVCILCCFCCCPPCSPCIPLRVLLGCGRGVHWWDCPSGGS